MFKIYKNGMLYKITESRKCVDNIIDRFLKTCVEYETLAVEKNGKIIEHYAQI